MKYITKADYRELRKKYSVIIGWGAGAEFQRYYAHHIFQFDYMIDGAGKNIGTLINGILVQGIDVITCMKNEVSLLVVIFPNIENEILLQLSELLPNADTIAARLLWIDGRRESYSADGEDGIMFDYITTKYDQFTYMDIGVCHPVVRNNTYLFYERGFTSGVLVEPNMDMCSIAAEYRPFNRIVNAGASPDGAAQELTYYFDPLHPGLNTFMREVAVQRKMERTFRKVPVQEINSIIADNFDTYPNILDIDTEGQDYELLSHLDFAMYPIDLICAEPASGDKLRKLMCGKGYRLLDITRENEIYVRI